MKLETVLAALTALHPAAAALPAIAKLVGEIGEALGGADQAELQRRYAALIGENDAGHEDLQRLLKG